jgi:dUTP pyrophosphatase
MLHNAEEDVQEEQPQAKKLQKLENGHEKNGGPSSIDLLAVEAPAALRVKKLSRNAVLPSRGSAMAAGYDLSSAYECMVPARGKALVKTDLSIAIPVGTYARVAPRSGLAWKHSIDVGAGVIDADYRGPVGVILFNHSDTDFTIHAGDRIAQLILELIVTPQVLEVEDLDATTRGEGGFGSTGIVALVAENP